MIHCVNDNWKAGGKYQSECVISNSTRLTGIYVISGKMSKTDY